MLIHETRKDIIIYYDSFLALVCLYLLKLITKMCHVKNNNFAVYECDVFQWLFGFWTAKRRILLSNSTGFLDILICILYVPPIFCMFYY